MNENLCIAIITTASIFSGFFVTFLSVYLNSRSKEYDENKQQFDALGRRLTLFRQLCGFLSVSNCLEGLRRGLMAGNPEVDEDDNVKSFVHAVDALHEELRQEQYKQYPYIDYRESDLAKTKTFVNYIWYSLIHKHYQNIHFSQPLDSAMGMSLGYFTTIRKELSFGNRFSENGVDEGEFGTIAGNVECEVIEDMEVLQHMMHKPIDCDVVAILRFTIVVSSSGIVVPLLLLWAKDYLSLLGCWNNLILFFVLAVFLYSVVMVAIHMFQYFQKKEDSKGKLRDSK